MPSRLGHDDTPSVMGTVAEWPRETRVLNCTYIDLITYHSFMETQLHCVRAHSIQELRFSKRSSVILAS